MKKKEIVLLLKQKADSEQPKSQFTDFSDRLVQHTDLSENKIRMVAMPDSPRRKRFPTAQLALVGSFAIVCGVIGINAIKDSSLPVYENGIIVTAESASDVTLVGAPQIAAEDEQTAKEIAAVRNTKGWESSKVSEDEISLQNVNNYFKTAETTYYASPSFDNVSYTVSYAICKAEKAELSLEKLVDGEWLVTPYTGNSTVSLLDRIPQNHYSKMTFGTKTSDGTMVYPDEGIYRIVLTADENVYAAEFEIDENSADNPLSWYVSENNTSDFTEDDCDGLEIKAQENVLSAGEKTLCIDISYNSDVTDHVINVTADNKFTLEKCIGGTWYHVSDDSFSESGSFQLVAGSSLTSAERTFDITGVEAGNYRVVKGFDVYEEFTSTGTYSSKKVYRSAEFTVTDNGTMPMYMLRNIEFDSNYGLCTNVYSSDISQIVGENIKITDKNYINRITTIFSALSLSECEIDKASLTETKLDFKAGKIIYSASIYSDNSRYYISADNRDFEIANNNALKLLLSYIERGNGFFAGAVQKTDTLDMSMTDGIFNVPECLTAGQAELLVKAYALALESSGLSGFEFDMESEPFVPDNSRIPYYRVINAEYDSYEELTEYAHSLMTDDVLNGIGFSSAFADVNNEIYYGYGWARTEIPCDYSVIEKVSENESTSVFRVTNVDFDNKTSDYYITFRSLGEDEWIITELQLWI